jgi:23S rRNA (guanosine2251-2'-O)-methyltransferase
VTRNDAHRLIEECMIAANVEAAVALRLAKAGSLYRVHGQPEDKRVTELQKVLNALQVGAVFSEKPTPREFRQLVERLAARPDGLLLESLVIRSLAQAVYQQTNIGHFGLALEEYAHFTSPIRRYPDLLVHRAIKAAVLPNSASGHRYSDGGIADPGRGEFAARAARRRRIARCHGLSQVSVPAAASRRDLRCDHHQRAGIRSVRAVEGNAHRWTGAYLRHSGRLLGARERRHGPGGPAHRRRWQMGDAVRVRLSRVDLTQRQIDFELLDADGAVSHGTVRAPRRGAGGGGGQPRGGENRARTRARRRSGGAARDPVAAAAEQAAGAAGVADSKRNFVYGLHAINAVLERAPERVLELWMAQPRDDARRDLRARQSAGVRVQAVGAEALAKLVGDVAHQGAVAAVRPLKAWDEHDLLQALGPIAGGSAAADSRRRHRPHNLGACLRTADAVGAHAVLIPKDRSAAVDGVVRKVAAGAAEFVPGGDGDQSGAHPGHAQGARHLGGGNRRGGAQTLYAADLKRPLALVLGAEGAGMRRLTRERCDFLVRIPMAGQVESLNVSVAAGVALFEARRQRAVEASRLTRTAPNEYPSRSFSPADRHHSLPHRSQREAKP